MRYRIFMIGLDVVFNEEKSTNSNSNKIKVLEIQKINTCTQGEVIAAAIKDFKPIIKKGYPDLELNMPENCSMKEEDKDVAF